MEYKELKKLNLPIPEREVDLTLIRFKKIFKLMQESQNNVVHNTELVVTGFETHEDRISYSENSIGPSYNVSTEGTITVRLQSLEDDKADKATTYTKIETNAEIDGSISSHDADTSAHPAIQQKITDDISTHNVSGASHMDIREAKLDKSVFEEFITNFDLEGDM